MISQSVRLPVRQIYSIQLLQAHTGKSRVSGEDYHYYHGYNHTSKQGGIFSHSTSCCVAIVGPY